MKWRQIITAVIVVGIFLGGLAIYSTRPPRSPDFRIGPLLPRGRVEPHLVSLVDQAILLAPDGSLWAWGGRQFQLRSVLGRPTITDRPKRIGNDSDWVKVAATWSRTLAIKSDGSVWGWGFNHNRPMVNIPTNYLGRPTRIGLDRDWSDISVGAGHCLALKTGGTLWAWGQNDHGQLGIGTSEDGNRPRSRCGVRQEAKRHAALDSADLARISSALHQP